MSWGDQLVCPASQKCKFFVWSVTKLQHFSWIIDFQAFFDTDEVNEPSLNDKSTVGGIKHEIITHGLPKAFHR